MTVHVTIELDEAVKARLDAFAAARNATSSAVAAQAISDLVDADAEFVRLVKVGMDQAAAGQTVPHEEVMADLRARRLRRS